MLARVRSSSFYRFTMVTLLAGSTLLCASCATKQDPQIVSDGTPGRESALPWNKQEKWEGAGQFGGLAEGMQGRR